MSVSSVLARLRGLDPRWYQIVSLSCLLVYGLTALAFDLRLLQVAVTIGVVLGTQYACTRIWRLPFFDPKSALISAIGLCLFLRTNHLWLVVVAAVLTIAMKFVIRWRGKHVFNPTNGALVLLLALGAPIWISAGQWGSVAIAAFFMACIGSIVVFRSARADVSIAFLVFWAMFLFGRSLWLGEPMTIPTHRLENGALLLFTFHMISDPKTTPDSRPGRILFAFLVALGAFVIQFGLFRTNGLLWSLAGCSLLVPLIDRFVKGIRYDWRRPTTGSSSTPPDLDLAPAE